MRKIRDLRLLIGAGALATAGTSLGFAIVAATAPVSSVAAPVCEGVVVDNVGGKVWCHDFGTSTFCVPGGVDPIADFIVCIPD